MYLDQIEQHKLLSFVLCKWFNMIDLCRLPHTMAAGSLEQQASWHECLGKIFLHREWIFPLSFRAAKVHVFTTKYENVLIVISGSAQQSWNLIHSRSLTLTEEEKKSIFLIFIHRCEPSTRWCGLHRFNTMAYHHHVVLCVVIFILTRLSLSLPSSVWTFVHFSHASSD